MTDYVSRLYEVYDMQDYLKDYAGTLMNYTIEEGDVSYQKKVPTLISVPLVVILQESCFFWNCRDGGTDEKTIMAPILNWYMHHRKLLQMISLSGMLRWTTRMSLVNWSGRSIK